MKFKSDRYFTIFDFFISHGQLLLRASKGEEFESNLDIIFFDVRYVQLKTYFKGLTIRKVEEKKLVVSYASTNEYFKEDQSNLFEIESETEKFYIAASFLHVYENALEFKETSLGVLEYKGRDNLIAEIR